jgi:hypothetical protein
MRGGSSRRLFVLDRCRIAQRCVFGFEPDDILEQALVYQLDKIEVEFWILEIKLPQLAVGDFQQFAGLHAL